jgi:hypothetical protein
VSFASAGPHLAADPGTPVPPLESRPPHRPHAFEAPQSPASRLAARRRQSTAGPPPPADLTLPLHRTHGNGAAATRGGLDARLAALRAGADELAVPDQSPLPTPRSLMQSPDRVPDETLLLLGRTPAAITPALPSLESVVAPDRVFRTLAAAAARPARAPDTLQELAEVRARLVRMYAEIDQLSARERELVAMQNRGDGGSESDSDPDSESDVME